MRSFIFATAGLVLALCCFGNGIPSLGQSEEPDAKAKALRRNIERALGKSQKGYFLVAKREITSAPRDPVEFTATLHVFEDRDDAVDSVFDYLKDDMGGRKGFRLVQRFDPTPIGMEAAAQFRDELEKSLRGVKLPHLTKITLGVIGPSASQQVEMGPAGVQITMLRPLPKTKKPMKVVMTLP